MDLSISLKKFLKIIWTVFSFQDFFSAIEKQADDIFVKYGTTTCPSKFKDKGLRGPGTGNFQRRTENTVKQLKK